jgi:flagellar assembly protein FliH
LSKIVIAEEGGWKPAFFEDLARSPEPGAGRRRFADWNASGHGYQLIRAVEQEAEQILLSAREVAQQIEREAYRDGRTKGEREAKEEMRRKLEPVEAMLKEACSQVAAVRQAVIRHAEGEVLDLAVAIAERVLRSEITARRDATLPIVGAALQAARGRKVLAIRVNPNDYEVLADRRSELLGSMDSARLVPDGEITPGGCVVEVDTGLVDARVESQVREAARLLGRDQIP